MHLENEFFILTHQERAALDPDSLVVTGLTWPVSQAEQFFVIAENRRNRLCDINPADFPVNLQHEIRNTTATNIALVEGVITTLEPFIAAAITAEFVREFGAE